jgi:hypothetical protein
MTIEYNPFTTRSRYAPDRIRWNEWGKSQPFSYAYRIERGLWASPTMHNPVTQR